VRVRIEFVTWATSYELSKKVHREADWRSWTSVNFSMMIIEPPQDGHRQVTRSVEEAGPSALDSDFIPSN
jgi:hypothetical protein